MREGEGKWWGRWGVVKTEGIYKRVKSKRETRGAVTNVRSA